MNATPPRRGRPPNASRQQDTTMTASLPTREQMDADRAESIEDEIARIRQNRVPLTGIVQRLGADTDPRYHYRWVNDDAGRIEMFQKGGYSIVQASSATSHDGVGSSVASVAAGINPEGRERRMVLMRTPQAIHADAVAEKRARLDELEAPIQHARPGKETQPMKTRNDQREADAGGFYTPSTGSSIHRQ